MSATASPERERMSGLAKGLAIIEAFGAGQPQLTVSEAARLAGLTRAAARRCLLTLADLGYLDYDGKFFRPLPRVLRLGVAYLTANPLPQLAQPILAAARDRLGESVSLAILEEGDSIFIARAAVARIVSTGVNVGARLPAYCSATGWVLLTALAPPQRRHYLEQTDMVARTTHTLTDPQAIFDAIETVARNGYAVSDEMLELGMRALAVPVHDTAGNVVAAMSVSAAAARLSVKTLIDDVAPVLREFAQTLERRL